MDGLFSLFFAYCFFMAGLLRWNGFTNYNGELITGGETVTIIFIMLISTTAVATAGTNLPAISGAKVAGKMAFEVIDQIPGVLADSKDAMVLKRDEFKGKIEFEDVCFNYPLNPDLKVLKNLNVTFEAG